MLEQKSSLLDHRDWWACDRAPHPGDGEVLQTIEWMKCMCRIPVSWIQFLVSNVIQKSNKETHSSHSASLIVKEWKNTKMFLSSRDLAQTPQMHSCQRITEALWWLEADCEQWSHDRWERASCVGSEPLSLSLGYSSEEQVWRVHVEVQVRLTVTLPLLCGTQHGRVHVLLFSFI